MWKIILGSLVALVAFNLKAQWIYNFENYNLNKWFSNDIERWNVSNEFPISGSYSLQHIYDNQVSGKDYIFCSYPAFILPQSSVLWSFTIRHGYNPSSNNRWLYYLASSDKQPFDYRLHQNYKALAVGINLNSSDDMLTLYLIENNMIKTLIKTNLNWEQTIGDNIAIIRVIKNNNGIYQLMAGLYSDQNHSSLTLLGEVLNNTTLSFNYFGIEYQYTSSQDRKLWIDNIQINAQYETSYPLKIDTTIFKEKNTVVIYFNQPLYQANSIITDFTSNPVSYYYDNNFISITSQEQLPQNNCFQIQLKGLQGYFYKTNVDTTLLLCNITALPFDIIISELMIDPTPFIKLPPYEYVELYNRSNKTLNLINWKISNFSSAYSIPKIVLQPGEYVILAHNSAKDKFDSYAKSIYCIGTSTFLPNEKGAIILLNEHNEIASYAHYDYTLFDTKYKTEGGWAIEMKDIHKPWMIYKNFDFSISSIGGTPGTKNSNAEPLNDTTLFMIQRLAIPTDSQVLLIFNKLPNFNNITDITNFLIKPLDINPKRIQYYEKNLHNWILTLPYQLKTNQTYELFINKNFKDASEKNTLTKNWLLFTLPKEINIGDIVISEIMFDTDNNVPEFIEIYNTTEKILNLGSLMFCLIDSVTGTTKSYTKILPAGLLIFPNEYIVFSKNAFLLHEYFPNSPITNIISLNNLFILPNSGGIIYLCTQAENIIIDKVKYNNNWHFPLISNPKNISLERINFEKSGLDAKNWHSASSKTKYATPGYANSQFNKNLSRNNSPITIEPELFSPNNDGVDDILNIKIEITEPSALVTIKIFDSRGYWLMDLAQNTYIGNQSIFYWDGTMQNRLIPVGMYILYIRIMDSSKILYETKKICVLTY